MLDKPQSNLCQRHAMPTSQPEEEGEGVGGRREVPKTCPLLKHLFITHSQPLLCLLLLSSITSSISLLTTSLNSSGLSRYK